MVGLEIPDIRLAQFFRPQIPDQDFCERYNHPQYNSLYMVCSRTWPAYIESVRNIERYQEEMEEILYGDLPAVLPQIQGRMSVVENEMMSLTQTHLTDITTEMYQCVSDVVNKAT